MCENLVKSIVATDKNLIKISFLYLPAICYKRELNDESSNIKTQQIII